MAFLKPGAPPPSVTPGLSREAADGGAPGREVAHAVADLRAGLPTLIADADVTLAALSAETTEEAGIEALLRLGGGAQPLLLLAHGRAAALLPDMPEPSPIIALALGDAPLTPARLHALADPTRTQPERPEPTRRVEMPPLAAACLALAKIGRLLPAMLVVPLAPGDFAVGPVRVTPGQIADAGARTATVLARVAEASVPLAEAPDARVVAFRGAPDGIEHLAILVGRPEAAAAPLVRIHSECFTGDLLGSLRCDCGPQLRGAIRRMADEGAGALLYLAQEGRGIGLVNKLRAYALQDRGMDTVDANEALGWGADERDFGIAAAMLRALGIGRVRLLTNNPRKLAALVAGGIATERVSHLFAANGVNDGYLAAKVARFGHFAD